MAPDDLRQSAADAALAAAALGRRVRAAIGRDAASVEFERAGVVLTGRA